MGGHLGLEESHLLSKPTISFLQGLKGWKAQSPKWGLLAVEGGHNSNFSHQEAQQVVEFVLNCNEKKKPDSSLKLSGRNKSLDEFDSVDTSL